jgi:hypothetical protein
VKKKPDRKLLLALGLMVAAACAAASAGPPRERQAQEWKPALKLGALEKTSLPGAS